MFVRAGEWNRRSTAVFLAAVCLAVFEEGNAHPPVIRIDVSADPVTPTRPDATIREITAAEVLLLATRSANTAGLLDQEADSRSRLVRTIFGRYRTQEQKVDRQLLSYSADEIRNRAAGLALEGFFRLIEADKQFDIINASITELEELLRTADKLQQGGLKPPSDVGMLRRQHAELSVKKIELEMARETGSMQLRTLLGFCNLPNHVRLRPKHNIVFNPDELCDDDAIAIAMKYRADLNLLRTIQTELTPGTLPRVRQILAGISVMLVVPQPTCRPLQSLLTCVFRIFQSQSEVESVRRQILSLLVHRETQVSNEVRADLRSVSGRSLAIAAAQDRVNDCLREVAEWEKKSKFGLSQNGELQRARLELMQAQSVLLHQAVEWEIARVNLRQHQGLLLLDAVEAGSSNP